jgi:adenosine kinase
MSDSSDLDVLAIGNALVDVLAHVDDDGLAQIGFEKASWGLVDEDEAERLYAAMPPSIEVSGGCAANTASGVDSMGGAAAYVGKVKDDQLGKVFTHDIRSAGVEFATEPLTDGPSTGRCLILVTPDAERTMRPYLGAAHQLAPSDIDEAQVARAQITYLEGFLWDPPGAKEAFRVAIAAAHRAGRKVALSLSDKVCVDNYRHEFLALLDGGHVDLVFCNEDEVTALFEVDDVDDAIRRLGDRCPQGVVTRGAQGSVVTSGDGLVAVPAVPVDRLVDTTGAGDLFAAGFLYGLTHGADAAECGRLGGIAAAEVISHIGARPEVRLSTLI